MNPEEKLLNQAQSKMSQRLFELAKERGNFKNWVKELGKNMLKVTGERDEAVELLKEVFHEHIIDREKIANFLSKLEGGEKISFCQHCHCVTKTIKNLCGKCGGKK